MTTLIAAERARAYRTVMRIWSEAHESCPFLKPDLLAAVDATDAWIDANAAIFNVALPVAFRTAGTLQQKTLLFCLVAMLRAGFALPKEG